MRRQLKVEMGPLPGEVPEALAAAAAQAEVVDMIVKSDEEAGSSGGLSTFMQNSLVRKYFQVSVRRRC